MLQVSFHKTLMKKGKDQSRDNQSKGKANVSVIRQFATEKHWSLSCEDSPIIPSNPPFST